MAEDIKQTVNNQKLKKNHQSHGKNKRSILRKTTVHSKLKINFMCLSHVSNLVNQPVRCSLIVNLYLMGPLSEWPLPVYVKWILFRILVCYRFFFFACWDKWILLCCWVTVSFASCFILQFVIFFKICQHLTYKFWDI